MRAARGRRGASGVRVGAGRPADVTTRRVVIVVARARLRLGVAAGTCGLAAGRRTGLGHRRGLGLPACLLLRELGDRRSATAGQAERHRRDAEAFVLEVAGLLGAHVQQELPQVAS